MASCYVLMLGKGAPISSPNLLSYKSDCYYDWFCFENISKGNNCPNESIQTFIKNNVYNTIKKTRNLESIDHRLLQSVILINDENDDFLGILTSKSVICPSLVFISFVYANSERISPSGIKDIFIEMNKMSNDNTNVIGVYSAFDHCEYIIVCDGAKISFEKYLSFIKKLKNDKNIYDVLSTYGFNEITNNWNKEPISALVKYKEGQNPINIEAQKNYATLGRFDYVKIYDSIEIQTLFSNVDVDNSKNANKLEKNFIGISEDNNLNQKNNQKDSMENGGDFKQKIDSLKKQLQSTYENCLKAYNTNINNSESIDGLAEAKNMIISILERGTSKYYALCIYNSFLTLLTFIEEKICCASEKNFEHNYGKGELIPRKKKLLSIY